MALKTPTSYAHRSPKDFIRGWLLRNPKPAKVCVTSSVGKRNIALHTMGDTWAQRAATIWALDPTLIEALTENDEVLRATRFDDDEEETDEPEVTPAAQAAVVVSATDPETARFELFARLYSQGVKDGITAATAQTDTAFTKLVEICNVLSKRGENLEKSLGTVERMLRESWRQNLELEAEAKEAKDPLTEIVEAFTGARADGEAAADAEHKTNGKA
jgi:hypothetical protein